MQWIIVTKLWSQWIIVITNSLSEYIPHAQLIIVTVWIEVEVNVESVTLWIGVGVKNQTEQDAKRVYVPFQPGDLPRFPV